MKKKIWLVDLTYTQQAISAETMPYGVACIAAYARTRHDDFEFRLFKYPEKLAAALEEDIPAVIGFSHYVWNSRLALTFAQAVRERSAEAIIVFGGPHYSLVSEQRAAFLAANPFIDFYIAGEGEWAFSDLLAALKAAGFDKSRVHGQVPSVHSIDAAGEPHLPAIRPRMPDLAQVPPPYLTGLLDEFFDGMLVPALQTNRGCPFQCTFCVEGESYYNKISYNTLDTVTAQLHYIGEKMQKVVAAGGRNELILTDSNFGMYRQDEQICDVIAECQDKYGWPLFINATTGKNRRERVFSAIKKTRGAIQLTGSVQSMDAVVLDNVRRKNIDTGILAELALRAAESGTGSYSEVILGLPGDSKAAHQSSIRQLLDHGFGSIVMFQLSMLPGSELDTPRTRSRFAMRTRYRIVPRCFGTFTIFGKTTPVAEIDEVCVGLDTLSFEDYVDCRTYDFFVGLLHNHGPFLCVQLFVKSKGLSVADWIEATKDMPRPKDLAHAVGLFVDETREQLHDSREELIEYIRTPGVIESYIAGERGNNAMYTYRAYTFMHAYDGLIDTAFRGLHAMFAAHGITLTQEELDFVASMQRHVYACGSDVLRLTSPDDVETELTHDVSRYEMQQEPHPVTEYAFSAPRRTRYQRSRKQRHTLEGYTRTMGADERGMGRALSNPRKLRHFLRQSATPPVAMAVGDTK